MGEVSDYSSHMGILFNYELIKELILSQIPHLKLEYSII